MTSIHNSLNSTAGSIGGQIASKLNASQGKDMSDTELLDLQHEMNRWSMITSLQSNIMKTMADGMKSTISNMR